MKILLPALLFVLLSVLNLPAQDGLYVLHRGERLDLAPVASPVTESDGISWYQTAHGRILGVKNTLIVKLTEGVDLEGFSQQRELRIVKSLGSQLIVVTPVNSDVDGAGIIRLSHELSNAAGVIYAQPDFISYRERR